MKQRQVKRRRLMSKRHIHALRLSASLRVLRNLLQAYRNRPMPITQPWFFESSNNTPFKDLA